MTASCRRRHDARTIEGRRREQWRRSPTISSRLRYNTAISRLMEFVNFFTSQETRPAAAMETFTLLLAPMAPHIAEELWHLLGNENTLAYEPWPKFDPALLVEEQVEIPVQVNGKLRGRVAGRGRGRAAGRSSKPPATIPDRRPARGQDGPQGRGGPGQAGQFRRWD